MTISQKIIKRIISDNDFSLRMAIHLKATQVAVILKARRKSNRENEGVFTGGSHRRSYVFGEFERIRRN